MRSGPHRDARPIDQRCDVMSVRAFHRERDDRTLALRREFDYMKNSSSFIKIKLGMNVKIFYKFYPLLTIVLIF